MNLKNSTCNNKLSSKKQSNYSYLSKTNNNYSREDGFAVGQNQSSTTAFKHTSLDMDVSLLDNKHSQHIKQRKKSKNIMYKWIQYICPGSRLN